MKYLRQHILICCKCKIIGFENMRNCEPQYGVKF